MKKLTKFITFLLCGICAMSAIACGGGDETGSSNEIDSAKTQLYISNYDAGIGRTWIETIAKQFEEDFKDCSFEDGKKGVQAVFNHNRTTNGTVLQANIANSNDNIFFTEGIDYPALASAGLILDISDVLNKGAITGYNASTGEYTRESNTILSKIDNDFATYLNRGTESSAKYYGLPYYLAVKGIIYDRGLWNEKCLFFAKEGCPSEGIVAVLNKANYTQNELSDAVSDYKSAISSYNSSKSFSSFLFVNENGKDSGGNDWQGLSAGPDGIYGTTDDGLPATIEETIILFDYIASLGNITPLIWTAEHAGYVENITQNLWQVYEGKDNLKAYFTLNGTIDDLVKFDSNGNIVSEGGSPVLESMEITNDNGYDAQRMYGKYLALQFAEKIVNSTSWYNSKIEKDKSVSHIQAQSKFLSSVNTNERFAMLVDGAWWQQESSDTFDTLEKLDAKYSKANRDFAIMKTPSLTVERYIEKVQTGEKNVVVAQNDSFCVLNANMKEGSAQYKVATAFASYINNDAMLNKFSEITNMTRGLNYEITSSTKANMSKYGKNYIEYLNELDVMYPYTNNSFVIKNYAYLSNTITTWNWHTKINGLTNGELYYPVSNMIANSQVNAKNFFEGLYNWQKNSVWTTKLIKD